MSLIDLSVMALLGFLSGVSVTVITLCTRDAPLGLGTTLLLSECLVVALLLVTLLVFEALDALLHGRPHIPPCEPCGSASFTCDRAHGTVAWTCACGRRYVRHGRQCRQLLPGGATRPYRRWRPLRGWQAERAEIVDPASLPYRGSEPPP